MTGHQRGLLAEYFTVGWNLAEGVVAIGAGLAAGSIALIGFGLDSYIEVASGLVLIWRLRKHGFGKVWEEAIAEKRAVFFVGLTFLALALYVTYESAQKLFLREQPEQSLIGIGLAVLSLVVMPALALWKKKIAEEIESRALRADAIETIACAYLSLTLLIGLVANALFGWWWADPTAALAMVYFLSREGAEAVREGREKLPPEL